MIDVLFVVVVAIAAIAVTTALAQRLKIAGPLVLVAVGLGVSLLPFVHVPIIDPEFILVGVLPPLLYSAAVRLPAIEFRRDFRPIAGLSIILVVISSIALGLFFWAAVPSIGLPLGIALGAILSPTDAVATSIAKRLGISPRVVTMLEGESLLNDATALVLLRTAIAAIAAGFSVGSAVGNFAVAVLVAVAVGAIVGLLMLRVRRWVRNSAAGTAISFTVPFLAYIPSEHLGGSGLVASVVAGIVTAQGATRWFTPEERLSDELNWRTIELVLEGGVFLIMGLELKEIVDSNLRDEGGLWHGTWLALVALLIIIAVRAAYVSFLLWRQGRRAGRRGREQLEQFSDRLDQAAADPAAFAAESKMGPRQRKFFGDPEKRIAGARSRVTSALADLDYYQSSPLGWKHGTIIVWAGMRGVVTLAAAQTLPRDDTIGDRALIIFVAFLVALISLMGQGFTLPWLVKVLGLRGSGAEAVNVDEQHRLDDELRVAAASALSDPDLVRPNGSAFTPGFVAKVGERYTQPPEDSETAIAREMLELRLILIEIMRTRLNELSRGGVYSTASLRHSLAELDAEQLSLELRLDDEE